MSDLVIVESPAKAKTIEKYLGKGFEVKSSMGHLRDLPKSTIGVDIQGGFIPQYVEIDGKEAMIRDLKKASDKSGTVYLATDPDREGEAISWHLKELLGLDDKKARRITFNEITKKVVTESIKNPRSLDMDRVDAQQARRILDRIVGYKLSPLLWKKIKRGLSAGRVQSVATRIVCDRENEIRAFVEEEYWSIDVQLRLIGKPGGFTARFTGDKNGKIELKNGDEAKKIVDAVTGAEFEVQKVTRGTKSRSPAPPFITSTLQQDASRRLGFQPRRTMSIAQQLYEGIDIEGYGSVGLITYMRTDSQRISAEAITSVRSFIRARYGAGFVPKEPRYYKTKSGAQDAHEAIRPTDVAFDPEEIKRSLSQDQYKLYKLIWGRFLACQMENAAYDTYAIDTAADGYIFRATAQSVRFHGFLAVYEEGRDDDGEEKAPQLPNIEQGEKLEAAAIVPEQHFTKPPGRFTEATLIRAMEEKGVGRPSTYAPTISTILEREYVIKESKTLRPTPLGEVVTNLMKDKFDDIIDVEFTARMESSLDDVEAGKRAWKDVLKEFYAEFEKELLIAEQDTERIKIPDEETDVPCDLCGRKMVIKSGRFGRFLACPGYPECKATKPITEEMPGACPNCASKILKRKSKNGYTYYSCEKGAECGFMSWDVPTKDNCPDCGKTLFKRSGKGAMKPFCINATCVSFLPEDKRGYKRKSSKAEGAGGEATSETAEKAEGKTTRGKKTAASKTAPKKSAAKKAPAKKKTAAKAPGKSAAGKSRAGKAAVQNTETE